MVGARCRCVLDDYTIEGTSRRVESEVGKKPEATGATRDKLLGFGSHNEDEILLLL